MATRDTTSGATQYATGVPALDHALYGGIPSGTLVLLESDSEGRGEELLRLFTLQRPTLFLSTTREACDVEAWLDGRERLTDGGLGSGRVDGPDDGSVPPTETVYIGFEEPLALALEQIDWLVDPLNVIVDSVDSLESEPKRTYVAFLQRLRRYIRDTDRIVYLHALDEYVADSAVNHHNRTQTRKLADIVWQLSVETSSGRSLTRMTTTKDRTGLCPDESLELEIGSRISVDNSRDIAL